MNTLSGSRYLAFVCSPSLNYILSFNYECFVLKIVTQFGAILYHNDACRRFSAVFKVV